MKRLLLVTLAVCAATGCVHPKLKFQKAHILDPTMDPQKTGGLVGAPTESVMLRSPERAQTGSGGLASTSCPTCGG